MKFPILYKRANSHGHINQWQVEVISGSYRTVSGYVGMTLTTSDWTECTPKNVGKIHETTSEVQAEKEAQALVNKKKDAGFWEDINDCDKKVFFQPMLAEDYDKCKNKVKFPILSQPKLDGIRCIVRIDGMWTRKGKEIISAPHIFKGLQHIFESNPNLVLDGELYTSNQDVDFNTIISCVRKTKPTEEDLEISKEYIEYWMYDMYEGEDLEYNSRRMRLHNIHQENNLSNNIYPIVATCTLDSFERVESKLAEYIAQGFEGQILRVPEAFYQNKRSKSLLKHKTFQDEEFTILSINEGVGKFFNKAATITIETAEGIRVDCGVNGSMQYIEEVWVNRRNLIGKQATVKYFEKTVDGSLRFPKVINIDRLD